MGGSLRKRLGPDVELLSAIGAIEFSRETGGKGDLKPVAAKDRADLAALVASK